jgi:hypothetical protein
MDTTNLWTAVVVGALALCTACTGGRITKNGLSVVHSEVSIWTCDTIGDYHTTTDANGLYSFNPFSSTSSAFDSTAFVPPGPIAITITGAEGSFVARRQHAYTQTCRIPYDGVSQDLPCDIQHVAMEPMGLVEFNAALLAFLVEDCGITARVAPDADLHTLSQTAQREMATHRSPVDGKAHVGCVTGCSQACAGQAPLDYNTCMCLCVEAACGVQFGPACVEATP